MAKRRTIDDSQQDLFGGGIPEMPRMKKVVKEDDNRIMEETVAKDTQPIIVSGSRTTDEYGGDADTMALDRQKTTNTETKEKSNLRQKIEAFFLALLPFVFLGAAIMGAYRSYTLCYGFFARYNTQDGAITMAGLLVAIAFAAPQAVPILWESVKKGKRVLLFIMVVLLSMASIGTNTMITATELQNQKADSTTAITEGNRKAEQTARKIEELERSRAELVESLEMDKSERAGMVEKRNEMQAGEWQYNVVTKNLNAVKLRIDTTAGKIEALDRELSGYRDVLAESPTSIGGNPVENTWINWAGSVIVEVGGPIVLALSLYL